MPGGYALGVLVTDPLESAALVDVLAGVVRPEYGELRVLGYDMSSGRGRAAARARVGVARRGSRQLPGMRIRGLVEHAARLAGPGSGDRHVLAAAILDRLALSPWSEVQVRLAPESVARRARLAAAAVHQPDLLLLDSLLDGLPQRDARTLAENICTLGRDTSIMLAGRDRGTLEVACDDILFLSNGVLVSS